MTNAKATKLFVCCMESVGKNVSASFWNFSLQAPCAGEPKNCLMVVESVPFLRLAALPTVPDRHASLCYKRCRDGYTNFGCCICYKGWSTYGRGVGIALVQQCPSHRPDLHVGLCYKKCRTGYTGVSSYVDTKSTWMVVFKVFSGST